MTHTQHTHNRCSMDSSSAWSAAVQVTHRTGAVALQDIHTHNTHTTGAEWVAAVQNTHTTGEA